MKNTVEAVRARVDEIDRRYAELSAEHARIGFEIEEAIKVASQRFLETNDMGGAKIVHELETRIELISRSMQILEQRKAEAEKDLRLAQAAEHRQRAGQLRDEAAGLEKKSGKLIDELSKIQDVQFDRSILECGRVGAWTTLQGGYNPAGSFDNPTEIFAEPGGSPGTYAASRSRRLLREAAELEAKAEELS
jgi:hypothetical protein